MRVCAFILLLAGADLVHFSKKQARDITKRLSPVDTYTGLTLPHPTWSLEHVVPQSRISPPGRKNDLHNLTGTHTRVNSMRGNKAFGNPATFKEFRGCKFSPVLFCPNSGKGEVARKVAYMTDLYGSSVDTASVISWETILEWNDRYPPNDNEKRKNELIFDLQGNWNRFIEDPTGLAYLHQPNH
ncbi:unnamed protein product [Ectocarpus sp. 6 AP-2014]